MSLQKNRYIAFRKERSGRETYNGEKTNEIRAKCQRRGELKFFFLLCRLHDNIVTKRYNFFLQAFYNF